MISFFFSSSTVNILLVTIIFLTFLILSCFFFKNVEFTRFLNRIGLLCLIFSLYLVDIDKVVRVWNKDISSFYVWIDPLFTNYFFIILTLIVAIFLLGISDRFFIKNSSEIEFSFLVFFIYFAALLVMRVHNFIDLILSIELITLASYVCVAFERKNVLSVYAGVQYFILGSLPSAMLILSSFLLYKQWGVFTLEDFDLLCNEIFFFYQKQSWGLENIHFIFNPVNFLCNNNSFFFFNSFSYDLNVVENFLFKEVFTGNSIIAFSLIFFFFNLFFKLTASPFHFWAPSVYGKGPRVFITYLSILSKVFVMFLFVRLLNTVFQSYSLFLIMLFLIISILTVFTGAVGAFTERFIKQFYVYSSMGHVSFFLLGISLWTLVGFSASFHYLIVYIISSYIMWFFIVHRGRKVQLLIQLKQIKNTEFLLAIFFAFLLFSMSGIPPFAGFFIKLDVLTSLMETSKFFYVYIFFFFTIVSFFYYLRLVKILFFEDESIYEKRDEMSSERIWIIVFFSILLLFYMFFVEKVLLLIQMEYISLNFITML